MKNDEEPWFYRLRTQSSESVSPLLRPAAPPGLELPPELELEAPSGKVPSEDLEDDSIPETKPVDDIAVLASEEHEEQFKVLLVNLPDAMLKECMLRAMLEQAKLRDIQDLAFRANGRALLTFASIQSVCKCISHFHGRQWGNANGTISAIRVCTRTPLSKEVPAQTPPAPAKRMSADASVFVPGGMHSTTTTFSADAPIFVPSSIDYVTVGDKFLEQVDERDRFWSYASTDVGSVSPAGTTGNWFDGSDSEMEVQVVCT